jgi:biotin carboxylase
VQGRLARLDTAGLSFPVIVKPTDSSGGRGIGVCAHPDQLPAALVEAEQFSASGVVIVEEYLLGTHHTAEAIVVDGRVALLSVGDRVLTPPPHFVTAEHRMPSGIVGLPERVRDMLDSVCEALGYRWGSLNVDVLVTPDDRVILVELGARLGGNGSAELLGLVYGVDVIEASVRLAVGERPSVASRMQAHAAFRVITAGKSGKLVAIHGCDAVRSLPGVIDLVIAAQSGDHVDPYHRAGAKLGYVLASAATELLLRGTLDRVDELLSIEVVGSDDGSDE